jgi:hypothetical protein
MVFTMSLFSRAYLKSNNQDRPVTKQNPVVTTLFDYASYYSMYITNTVTNQVKYSFEFTFIIRHVIYSPNSSQVSGYISAVEMFIFFDQLF